MILFPAHFGSAGCEAFIHGWNSREKWLLQLCLHLNLQIERSPILGMQSRDLTEGRCFLGKPDKKKIEMHVMMVSSHNSCGHAALENSKVNLVTPKENMARPVTFNTSEMKYTLMRAPVPNASTKIARSVSTVKLAPTA